MSARKILTPEQKVAILRKHLIEKVPVSQVCEKNGVSVGNSTFVACDFSRQNACTDTGRMYPSSVSFP